MEGEEDTSETRNSLIGFAMLHKGLIVLKSCNAVLRRDYNHINKKVKLLTGGTCGNELNYCGFIGPGMLTGSVFGDALFDPSVHTISKVIREIGLNHSPGVLLIIPNSPNCKVNFGLAMDRASLMGIRVRSLIVEDIQSNDSDDTNNSCGILILFKIAGSMAEDGKTIEEISEVCQRITKTIISTNISWRTYSTSSQFKSLLEALLTPEGFLKEPYQSKHSIAVVINYTGVNNYMKVNIFIKELLELLGTINLNVERVYSGTLMSSLNWNGFQVSLFNLSLNADCSELLDATTVAPAWPRAFCLSTLGEEWANVSPDVVSSSVNVAESNENDEIKAGPSFTRDKINDVLIIVSFACEALIACAGQLNTFDEDSGDYGTTIERGAQAIKNTIQKNGFKTCYVSNVFFQISEILEATTGGLQLTLYSLFFNQIAKTFAENPSHENVTVQLWLEALSQANQVLSKSVGAEEGDRTVIAPLMASERALRDALEDLNVDLSLALGEAVKAAELRALDTRDVPVRMESGVLRTFQYPDPGAHAVGIWMRAAYEGFKLRIAPCYAQK